MRSLSITIALAFVLAGSLVATAVVLRASSAASTHGVESEAAIVRHVAGSGVHFTTTAIVHSVASTETGLRQQSTETVDLTGDLTGRILYQPTTVVDFSRRTATNTGRQVFSGTVLGSAPVMLYDDEFRFEIDLDTGAASGKVFLTDSIAGPRIRCELDVIATGRTADGNITASYTGYCTFKND